MNVTYVTMAFPYPSETFATNEVRALIAQGASVTIEGLRRPHPRCRDMLRDRGLAGVRVTHNGVIASARGAIAALARPRLLLDTIRWVLSTSKSRPRDLLGSLGLLPRAFDILARLERSTPDVLHMYWSHYPTLVGRLVQRRLPRVVTSVSFIAYDLARAYGGTPSVARQADVIRTVAAVNRAPVASLTGVDRERIEVVHDGVDVAWIDSLEEGVTRTPRSVVAVGRLVPGKGMDDVLRMFARLHAHWPDARLTILGEGPERRALELLAASLGLAAVVEFRGHVPHADVVRTLWRSEVAVLLSRSERLPNVVKEGMACGCVCVTTPTEGIDELVVHGVTGYLVPMADPVAACDVIDDVFAGRGDGTMAARAASFVREAFALERSVQRSMELWRAAFARRRRGGSDAVGGDRAAVDPAGRDRGAATGTLPSAITHPQ